MAPRHPWGAPAAETEFSKRILKISNTDALHVRWVLMSPDRSDYYLRTMAALVVVLAGLTAVVQLWPTFTDRPDDAPFASRPSTQIDMRHIQPTNQAEELTPAPPAPLPPVVVPNDVLITQEVDLGEAELRIDRDGDDRTLREGTTQATTSRRPDTEARLLRNVQPRYPPEARRKKVRARVEVEVYIAENGQVRDASVRRRWIVAKNGSSQPVAGLQYGLEEAALRAARRSLFRPARQNGTAVTSRKVMTFTFGVDRP